MAPSSRTVLVTGGAKGVGRGITESFLANGDRVLICGRGTPESLPSVGDHQAEFFAIDIRSEEHTSELQSLMRISYAVFCLKKKTQNICKNSMTIAST